MRWVALLAVVVMLAGCGGKAPAEKSSGAKGKSGAKQGKSGGKKKEPQEVASRSSDRLPAPPPLDPNEPPPQEKQTYTIRLRGPDAAPEISVRDPNAGRPSAPPIDIIEPVETIRVFAHSASRFSITPDERLLAMSGDDEDSVGKHIVRIFDVQAGKPLHDFTAESIGVIPAVLSPDGKRIVYGGSTMMLANAATGKEIGRLLRKDDSTIGIAIEANFAPDGRSVWTIQNYDAVVQFDAATGKEQRAITEKLQTSTFALFPDGKRVAIGYLSGGVSVVDLETEKFDVLDPGGERPAVPGDAKNSTQNIVVAPDASCLVAWQTSGDPVLWDLETKSRVREFKLAGFRADSMILLQGHRLLVAQGSWFTAAGERDYAKEGEPMHVIEVDTGRRLAYLTLGDKRLHSWGVQSSVDESRLYVAVEDGTVRVFDMSRFKPSE